MPTKNPIGSCIIVGAGPAGLQVAQQLAKLGKGKVAVTLIDRQDYLDWSLASPRSLVAPEDVNTHSYCMPMTAVVKHVGGPNAKFVQASVETIHPKSVALQDGTVLEADTIVVAVGGHYANGALWKPLPHHTTKEARIQAFRDENKKLANCQSVVVAGAGPTGVEVAGELQAAYPNMTVTLVGTLLPGFSSKNQMRMKQALESMGVHLMEGRVVSEEPDGQRNVHLRDGRIIEKVDHVLNAAGMIFAGASLASSELKQDVTSNGQFRCRPTLQLQSSDTVFCTGDVLAVPDGFYADVKGMKQLEDTAIIVAKNVVATLQQGPLQKFHWSKTPKNDMMITTLGPKKAIAFLPIPAFIANFMARKIKSTDFYMSVKAGSLYGKGKTW